MILLRLTIIFSLPLLMFQSCDDKLPFPANCMTFQAGVPFEAAIQETWCDESGDFALTLGPILEDSRCNVPGIKCVWAGRFVLAATFQHAGISRDTFYAVEAWRDTIVVDNREIILDKIFPETRTDMGIVDTSAYRFRLIINK